MPPARQPDQSAPRTVSPTGVGYDGPKEGRDPRAQAGDSLTSPKGVRHPRHRPLAQGRPARPGPAGGLPPAREDHALRPRAHPGARGARPRRRRARRLHRLRHRREDHPGRRAGREGPARRRSSSGSPPCSARAARPTPRATPAVSRRSSTRRRATGTWSATTCRSSSSRTRSSSPTSSTPASRTPTGRSRRRSRRTTRSGTSSPCTPRPPTTRSGT